MACGPQPRGGGDGGDDVGVPDAGPACVDVTVEAQLVERPVDIIVVVDTSPTMGPAVAEVEASINGAFASIIEAAGIDYRVILLASGVAIGPPLSISGRFFPYAIATGSGDAYQVIGDTYSTWSPSLRADAFKVFLWFSDSSSGEDTGEGVAFDQFLLSTDPVQFGTSSERFYLLHSIVGVEENNPPVDPWLPSDPLLAQTCVTSQFPTGPGAGFQELSILTGGLRFPICQFAYFDSVFRTLADSVITGAGVPCVFQIPDPPPGQTLDLNTIEVLYTSGNNPPEFFTRVADAAQCVDGAYYIDGNEIRLCPATCERVRDDVEASIEVRFDCVAVLE